MAHQQNFGAGQRPPHHHGHRIHIPVGLVVLVIVLILIIGGAYYLITSGGTSVAISSAQNINVGTAGTIVSMGGAEYMIALSKAYPSSGLAFVYVNKLPMFVNPIFNVSISTTSPTKLSTATKNGYANIQLEAVSIANSSMVLKVTPLDTSLAISPDYGKSTEIESYFGNGTVGESLISTPGTNTTTTTVPPVITSGGTTVASTSTTTIAANNTNANILAGLHKSPYYPVLVNLSTLYANSQQCNQADYNSAYIHQYSHAPQPPTDYPNQSQVIPYQMYMNVTNEGSGIYGFAYRTKTQLFGDGPAMTIAVNAQASNVVNVTFASHGVFVGFTGVGDLKAIYNRAVLIGGNCGIEVP
ncbi:MAG TPA: hypothetical protein VND15_02475 [Candidatus Acidoferrales bacterium]|nr:hypothetical protein [Candidatus Acidoferrales bacterium]